MNQTLMRQCFVLNVSQQLEDDNENRIKSVFTEINWLLNTKNIFAQHNQMQCSFVTGNTMFT